jgi:hypothetical protein
MAQRIVNGIRDQRIVKGKKSQHTVNGMRFSNVNGAENQA